MEIQEFHNKAMMVIDKMKERIPSVLGIGYNLNGDMVEIFIIDPFGQPIQIFTLFIHNKTKEVCWCSGQMTQRPPKDIS